MKKTLLVGILSLGLNSLYASSLEVGLGSLKFDYNEYKDNGVWLDSEKSSSYKIDGGFVKYEHDLEMIEDDDLQYNQLLEVYYSYHFTTTNYDGSLSNGTPYKGFTDNYLSQGHLRYKVLNKVENHQLGLFAGLGYRYWARDILGAHGYLEEYEWPYYEAGLAWQWQDGDFYLGLEASYQKAYKPKMYAHLNGGLDFDLGETKGYKFKIPLGYKLNENWDISVKYIYDKWTIERSNTVKGYYEPKSFTKNSYTYFSLGYKF